ncbi:FlxA-like family protein [Clostridium estertheticum]|uniref:FlxA-like family protein n=1 Tax=Clostridium estertheticum TaxID=238834 RepID=UPI0013E965E0|nr:FlxA-like family protein [Clostridium estertheticum]MBZ9686690.1 FlxA-like family protein [Clostridium estertheticum]
MSISSILSTSNVVTNNSSDISQLKLQESTLKSQLSQISSSIDDEKIKQVKIQVIAAKIQQIQAQIQQLQTTKTGQLPTEKVEPSKDVARNSNITKVNSINPNNIIELFA